MPLDTLKLMFNLVDQHVKRGTVRLHCTARYYCTALYCTGVELGVLSYRGKRLNLNAFSTCLISSLEIASVLATVIRQWVGTCQLCPAYYPHCSDGAKPSTVL